MVTKKPMPKVEQSAWQYMATRSGRNVHVAEKKRSLENRAS